MLMQWQKLVLKYKSDSKFRQRVKLVGAAVIVFSVLAMLSNAMDKVSSAKSEPKQHYKVDVTALTNNQANNPYEKEGLVQRIEELKKVIRQGSQQQSEQIKEQQQQLSKEATEIESLKTQEKMSNQKTQQEFEDRFDILAQQYEKKLKEIEGGNQKDSSIIDPATVSEPAGATAETSAPSSSDGQGGSQSGSAEGNQDSTESEYASLIEHYQSSQKNNGAPTASSTSSAQTEPGVNGVKSSPPGRSSAPTASAGSHGDGLSFSVVSGSGGYTVDKTGVLKEVAQKGSGSEHQDEAGAAPPARAAAEKPPAKKQIHKSFLPAGSLLQGVLLTGVDAPTDKGAQNQPSPVMIRIKKEAILPNRFRLDVRECFVIGSSFGRLNTSRVYVRADRITCVRQDGGVIETPLKAYAVGEDGKLGMAGRIVSRQGTVIARSILSGFLSGIAKAFTPQQVPVIVSTPTTGGTTPYQHPTAGDVAGVAAYNGVATAAGKVADYYLKLAEDLHPVIEMPAGRKIDLVVLQGTELALRN